MEPQFEGTEIKLGGQSYTLPPLSLGQIKRLRPKLDAMRESPETAIDTMAEAIHMALSRNYPEMTREQVEDMVDTGNVLPLFRAVVTVSGMELRAPGGEKAGSE